MFDKMTSIDNSFMHTDILEYNLKNSTYTALVRTFADSELIEFEV